VPSVERNFLLFKTDLFLYWQRDKDIGQWFVGGDCAGWFYVRLLSQNHIQPSLEPVMEDWGWTFEVLINDVIVRFNVWDFLLDNCWLFGLEVKKRFFRRQNAETLKRAKNVVCDALEDIITHDPRLLKHEWFADCPFELDVKEF
jgi:hypothetical protein